MIVTLTTGVVFPALTTMILTLTLKDILLQEIAAKYLTCEKDGNADGTLRSDN